MSTPETARPEPQEHLARRVFLIGAGGAAFLLGLRIDGTVVAAEQAGSGRFSAFLEITPGGGDPHHPPYRRQRVG